MRSQENQLFAIAIKRELKSAFPQTEEFDEPVKLRVGDTIFRRGVFFSATYLVTEVLS